MEERKDEMKNSITPREELEGKINVWGYISRHKGIFFLIAIIVVLFVWATVRMNIMERRFEKQKDEIRTSYNQQMERMNTAGIETSSRVFSWAIRNEQLRRNNELINQLFLNYSQLANAQKISLIDGETYKILISTDKTQEGIVFPNIPVHIPDQVTISEDSFIRTVSPLFGTNNKLIGILVIDYNKYKPQQ